jgi:TRAP-type C4-dicarboxylate transport system substrate-binding protein
LDDIERRNFGRLTFYLISDSMQVKGADEYDAVKVGSCDFGIVYFNNLNDRLPLGGAFSFPVAYDPYDSMQELVNSMGKQVFNKYSPVWDGKITLPPAETKILTFFQQQPCFLFTARKQVKTPEDLQGLKISASSPMQMSALELLGAVPVSLLETEVYEAISKGVIDGALLSPSTAIHTRITSVTKYVLRLPFGSSMGIIHMNIKSWSSIPTNLSNNLQSSVFDINRSLITQFYKDNDRIISLFPSNAVYNPSSIELNEWAIIVAPVVDRWIADMESKGWPAKALVDIIKAECKKRGVLFPYSFG